jgi:Trypsin-like peptidase domain
MRSLLLPIVALLGLIAAAPDAPPSTAPTADWAKLPPDQWPQLVLTNEATFDGHSPLHGASSFLMKLPDGEVVVGTAKHLIKKPGGVDPPITLADLDHVLTRWRVFPRTKSELALEAKGIVESVAHESTNDWLMLHLAKEVSTLPSTPLVPRPEPVDVGETVYLIGVSYEDKEVAQNVYKGVVTGRPRKNYFTYEFDPPVRIAGFSGAPIVDTNGLLVGHGVSMSKTLKQKDGLEVEFGGEDAALALQLWRHRNDGPATRPADALHLDLPSGWEEQPSKVAGVIKYARNSDHSAYVDFLADSKADFSDDMDLMTWVKRVKASAARMSKLDERDETEIVSRRINDRDVLEFEITGELDRVKLHYRMDALELNGCYCRMVFWTVPSKWDDMQGEFDAVVQSLK